MKRFRFRLESVLRVRRIELDRARGEFAASAERSRMLGARADRERAEAERALAQIGEGAARGLAARDVALAAQAAEHGFQQRAATERALSEERKRGAELRRELIGAEARVRGLERLRERAFEDHRSEWLREQQRDLDEAARSLRAAGECEA